MESTMLISASKRGTVADYKAAQSGDFTKLYGKVFTFVLNHKIEEASMFNPRTKEPVRFPPSYTLPLIDSIRDEENGGMKVIRYITGEDTLTLNQQKLEDRNYKEYAEFTQGVKHVSGDDKLLLDFFMNCNANGSNLKRDKTKNIIFYMVDAGEGLKDVVKKKQDSFKLQEWCFNGAWDEIQAYARVLGIQMDLESSEIRYNLSLMAEKDPIKFEKGMNNPVTKRKHYALMAAERGIIVIDDALRTVSWPNGTNPLSAAPPNISAIDQFVESTFTTQGEQVFASIMSQLNPKAEIKTEITEVRIPEQKSTEPLIKSTDISFDEANELFDMALTSGVITKPSNNSFEFDGFQSIGKSKILAKMKDDSEFLSKLKAAVRKA